MKTEICVIGGGPAGAVIAKRLSELGHGVTVVERERFPRPHVGESLPPSILPLLDAVGLRQQIEAENFLRPERAIIRWTGRTESFKESLGEEPGFQVDRARFDQILLSAASESGARLLQPARALAARHCGRNHWHILVQTAQGRLGITAEFIVDASGRRSFLPGKRKRFLESTLAIYGYWRGTGLKGSETRIEAGSDHWYWGAPLPDGSINATVFVDPQQFAQTTAGLEAFYRRRIGESGLLRKCLDGELVGNVHSCDAGGYYAASPVTIDSLKVGEASYSIDPLSSQGVQAAVVSAIQGAVAVHTLLTKPDRSAAATRFVQDRQHEAIGRHRKWASQFYSEHRSFAGHSFWRRRARQHNWSSVTPNVAQPSRLERPTGVRLSPAAKIVETPVIRGEFVDVMPALEHPNLDRPVAYLHSIEVASLLPTNMGSVSLDDLHYMWSARISKQTCWRIIQWMWSRGILIPAMPRRLPQDEKGAAKQRGN